MNEEREREFEDFLRSFVRELNLASSEDGAVVLVEGKRDLIALRAIGYRGRTASIASLHHRNPRIVLAGAGQVIILTDLDREGRRLAVRYMKLLARSGFRTSLAHRRRLSSASGGAFLQVENLRRFAHLGAEALLWQRVQSLNKGQN